MNLERVKCFVTVEKKSVIKKKKREEKRREGGESTTKGEKGRERKSTRENIQ